MFHTWGYTTVVWPLFKGIFWTAKEKNTMDLKDRLKEFLEMTHSLLQADMQFCGKNCEKEEQEEEEEEEEEEEKEKCEFYESLKNDYEELMMWVFGRKNGTILNREALKIWKELHPTLPIPRVFETVQNLGREQTFICLLLDVFPLFLKEKNKPKSRWGS
jgi:hypothetical protein